MRRIVAWTVPGIALAAGWILADQPRYHWPLGIYNGFSSSFMEYRGNHFHAGVDLRTHQQTGYPVMAIADGSVIRIRSVKRGSGNGVYIRHTDGYLSKYFHLERFNHTLAQIAGRVRERTGKKYFGNHELQSPILVSKGDLIGFSGETGSGFPHLHLEIRDPGDRAVNPMEYLQLPGGDPHPPRLKRILIRTGDGSLINTRIGEIQLGFGAPIGGIHPALGSIYFSGSFEPVVNALDISDTGKYVAPYIIDAWIDDHHFFQLHNRRFAWADNNQLGFVYDLQHSSPGAPYYNLFSQPGYGLEKYRQSLSSLLAELTAGGHRLKVAVGDYQGNRTVGEVHLVKYDPPVISLRDLQLGNEGLRLVIDSLSGGLPGSLRLELMDRDLNPVGEYILPHRSDPAGRPLFVPFESPRPPVFLQVSFIHHDTPYFKRRFYLPRHADHFREYRDLDFSTFVNGNTIFLSCRDFPGDTGNIRLRIRQGEREEQFCALPGGGDPYFVFSPLTPDPRMHLGFILMDERGAIKEISHTLRLVSLIPGLARQVTFGDFSAVFARRSVRLPKVLLFRERNAASEYEIVAGPVELAPFHFPFLDRVDYAFSFDPTLERKKQLGIFEYREQKQTWSYRYSRLNSRGDTYATRVLHSGVFALLRDHFPPRIILLKLNSSRLEELEMLPIRILDKGKGVDDRYLRIHINEREVRAEYDPDRRMVRLQDLRALKRGWNIIRVGIRDHGGNRSEKTFKIYLK